MSRLDMTVQPSVDYQVQSTQKTMQSLRNQHRQEKITWFQIFTAHSTNTPQHKWAICTSFACAANYKMTQHANTSVTTCKQCQVKTHVVLVKKTKRGNRRIFRFEPGGGRLCKSMRSQ